MLLVVGFFPGALLGFILFPLFEALLADFSLLASLFEFLLCLLLLFDLSLFFVDFGLLSLFSIFDFFSEVKLLLDHILSNFLGLFLGQALCLLFSNRLRVFLDVGGLQFIGEFFLLSGNN